MYRVGFDLTRLGGKPGCRWVVVGAVFVDPEEWVNNRGPRCCHAPEARIAVLQRTLSLFDVTFSEEVLDSLRRRCATHGVADVKEWDVSAVMTADHSDGQTVPELRA